MDRYSTGLDLGLTRGGFNVLQVVGGADEPLTPGHIAERVLLRSATVTRVVDTIRGLADTVVR